jgi:hypothetical protein
VLACLAFTSPAAAKGLDVRADPSLFPRFASGVSDYVNHCSRGGHVTIRVTSPRGTRVSVGGTRLRSGKFRARRALDPGQQLEFRVKRRGRHRTYHLRCLPSDFPAWTFTRRGRPSDAFYVLTLGKLVAIWDARGVPIWWMRTKSTFAQDAKVFDDETIGWFPANSPYIGPPAFEIRRLDGSLVTSVGARADPPSTDEHDIQRLPNGDYLLDTYRRRTGTVDMSSCGGPRRAVVYDAEIQRIRPGRAEPVWSWSTKDHIAPSETGRWCPGVDVIPQPDGTNAYDLIHLNSLQLVRGSVIVSTRHTDAAYKIDYATGRLAWKLGGTHTAKSLRIVGDRFAATDFGGPHFARELPDGTITIYDNGRGRHRASRALRFRVDEKARTATLIDEVEDPTGRSSQCCGSAEVRPGGAWLISWGHKPLISEVADDGSTRFNLTLARGYYSYRVSAIPWGGITRQAFRLGMDGMHPR